jgi:hypothetical protein
MKVKELHDWEKDLFEKYQDGLINDIEYFGELFFATENKLEQLKEKYDHDLNTIIDYLYSKADENE